MTLLLWRHTGAAAHTHTQTDRQSPNEHIIATIHYIHLAEIVTVIESKLDE